MPRHNGGRATDSSSTERAMVNVGELDPGAVPRYSYEQSAKIAQLLKAWIDVSGIRSVYGLAILTDVPRASLQRWLTEDVRLPKAAVRALVDELAQHSIATASAQQALADLIDGYDAAPADIQERLRAELRRHGGRIAPTMAALNAAGLKLIAADNPPRTE